MGFVPNQTVYVSCPFPVVMLSEAKNPADVCKTGVTKRNPNGSLGQVTGIVQLEVRCLRSSL